MKLPRDVSGQTWSRHCASWVFKQRVRKARIRVTTGQMGQHHEVIPNHYPIKPGTLHGILKSVASHHKMTVDELINTLKL